MAKNKQKKEIKKMQDRRREEKEKERKNLEEVLLVQKSRLRRFSWFEQLLSLADCLRDQRKTELKPTTVK